MLIYKDPETFCPVKHGLVMRPPTELQLMSMFVAGDRKKPPTRAQVRSMAYEILIKLRGWELVEEKE